MTRETSIPGIYAAGDLTTRAQAAVLSAAAGMQAAAVINAELTADLVTSGELRRHAALARQGPFTTGGAARFARPPVSRRAGGGTSG